MVEVALGATQTADAGVAVAVADETAEAFGATQEALAGVAVAVALEVAGAFGATQFAEAGVAVERSGLPRCPRNSLKYAIHVMWWSGSR